MEQRVTDSDLGEYLKGYGGPFTATFEAAVINMLAHDLQDARAEVERLRALVYTAAEEMYGYGYDPQENGYDFNQSWNLSNSKKELG